MAKQSGRGIAGNEAGTPSGALPGTHPLVPDARSVESVLREYLNKPTAPRMDAVRLEALAAEADAEISIVPATARSGTHLEDDRPTGRWSTPVDLAPRSNVRDRGVLVRIDGESSGEVLSLPRAPVLIGRSSTAHVHVSEPSASREHARIFHEDGAFHVEDLGSQNGTEVSGQRVARAELRDGDLLQIGQRAMFRFHLMDQAQEDVMRRLYDSSMRDPLTNADNRRSLDSRILSEIAFARRHKRQLSLILLDIDFFKQINDRHGHPAGDEVLKVVAKTVRNQLRTEDVFARYGGEEFAILLRDTALPEAAHVAERVRERLARAPISAAGKEMEVTVSGGCSSLACCVGTTAEELMGVADRRLYRAKRSGRNRIVSRDEA